MITAKKAYIIIGRIDLLGMHDIHKKLRRYGNKYCGKKYPGFSSHQCSIKMINICFEKKAWKTGKVQQEYSRE